MSPQAEGGFVAGRNVATDDGLPVPRRYVAIGVILATLVMTVLDGTIANVALPSISHGLVISSAATVWVVTAYQLAVVVTLLPAAALGESYGSRRVYIAGIAIFLVGSALCALSVNLMMLAAARFLQGVGGGFIMALGAMMLRYTYPQRMLGRAIAWNAMAVALSSATAPALGGFILSFASWPWLFAINLPIGILVLAVARALPAPTGTRRSLDVLSVAINGVMFLAFVFGADRLVALPLIGVGLLVVAALAMMLLIRRERGKAAPLIPIDLFGDASFTLAASASATAFAAQMVGAVALPFYLQHQLGLSTVETGLYMMPWPIAILIVAPISGRLADRLPAEWLCVAGCVILAIGLCSAGLVPLGDGLWPLVVSMLAAGGGFGLFNTANNRTLLLTAPKARSGAAGGVQASARLTGQTVGAIAMALLFTVLAADIAPRAGLIFGAVMAIAAAAISTARTPGRGAA